jgi:nitronate monooxygenase
VIAAIVLMEGELEMAAGAEHEVPPPVAMWPDRRLLDRIGIDLPIIQSPMGGACGTELAIAVSEAGGLGSLPCAILTPARMRADISVIRQRTSRPLNANFFAYAPEPASPARDAAWMARLSTYYAEFGLDAPTLEATSGPMPFDEAMCEIVEEFKPEVVSFHIGLPAEPLLARVKATGCFVISTATTPAEARWLEGRGCDAIIAQGYEAGGHRGMFLTHDLTTQIATLALVPKVVDAVKVPVIAAGGVGDGRGLAAVLCLGAAAAQVGTAFLLTPESLITGPYRAALADGGDQETALTNVFSGRAARTRVNRLMREVGPISDLAPPFPTAGRALAPLRTKAEAAGSGDFSAMWAGQAASLCQILGAGDLTRKLAEDARQTLLAFAP